MYFTTICQKQQVFISVVPQRLSSADFYIGRYRYFFKIVFGVNSLCITFHIAYRPTDLYCRTTAREPWVPALFYVQTSKVLFTFVCNYVILKDIY